MTTALLIIGGIVLGVVGTLGVIVWMLRDWRIF